MRELFITIISALLCLPLAAVEREDEAFPLDTADVVWTFTEGNRVKLLNNADAKFRDLFACIDTARHSVHLEYFNFRNDSINKLMMTLLARKLYEGVEVRILFDDFGNISNDQPIRRKHIREMRSMGFKIQSYDPMLFPWINHAFHRDHRKVAVIDGQTAFIGGVNIADYYVTGLSGVGDWRDMHLHIEGPAANIIQRNFITMWNAETNATTGVYTVDRFETMDGYNLYMYGAAPLLTLENPANPEGRELIIFRDSFSSSLVPLMAGGYSKITLVDLRYMASQLLPQFVDFHGQDVLFLYSSTLYNSGSLLK